MIEIRGKYNFANVMLPNDSHLDEETKKQIYGFLNHPAFQNTYIAIMPDCHKGAGSCIGFTMKMNDYIIPNLVGVDIGCGVRSINLGKVDLDFAKIDNFIKENIPNGYNVNDKLIDLDNYDIGNYDMRIDYDIITEISEKIKNSKKIKNCNPARNCLALGSLGGGNHFIEIGIDKDDNKWLTVHTGSRKFGLEIANYHQKIAAEFINKLFFGASAYKGLEYLMVESNEGKEYLNDMRIAQAFAIMNRVIIIDKISDFIMDEFILKQNPKQNVIFDKEIESIHNFIDFEDHVIRKGAIRSYEDEEVIIPFNMEDGLIIGSGKSNSKWNYSVSHGAGRILSRKKAKAQLNLEKAKKSMSDKGIYTTSLCKDTLDEVKDVYKDKDKDMIIKAIKETVDVKNFVKPIYNFKSKQ